MLLLLLLLLFFVTWLSWGANVLGKLSFQNVFHLHENENQFFRFVKRLRKAPFLWRNSLDGRPYRRDLALFQIPSAQCVRGQMIYLLLNNDVTSVSYDDVYSQLRSQGLLPGLTGKTSWERDWYITCNNLLTVVEAGLNSAGRIRQVIPHFIAFSQE